MNVAMQCVLLVALFLLEMVAAQKGGYKSIVPVLQTSQGNLIGNRETTDFGTSYYTYLGIPYAKSPVGHLRFKDPEVWENWSGTRHSISSGPPCPLTNGGINGEEDCLYLNVYTPQHPGSSNNLPVMVFFEGGGFTRGNSTVYSPRTFMDSGVIFITAQYRIGIFGFLSMEDSVIPGNFGLKDQTMALRWVQENIEYFGGDPLQVTIVGQSARAASIQFQILSPYAAGLFSKAIMQSGSGFAAWSLGKDFRRLATAIAQRFNCPTQSQEILYCLQQLDINDFSDVLAPFHEWESLPQYMGPRVDGDFLPDEPAVLLDEGRYNDVDIISGVCKDEGAYVIDYLQSNEARFNDIIQNFTRLATLHYGLTHEDSDDYIISSILRHYLGRPTVNKGDVEVLAKISGDVYFTLPHDLHSILHLRAARYNKKVYLYELNHVGEYNIRSISSQTPRETDDTHVYHGDDLLFLFDFDGFPLERNDDIQVRDIMVSTWVNFAKTGDPTPDDSLGFMWEPAHEFYLEHLVIKPSPFMEQDQRADLRRFWANLPVREFHLLRQEVQQVKKG